MRKEIIYEWFQSCTPSQRLQTITGLIDLCYPVEIYYSLTYLAEVSKRNDFKHDENRFNDTRPENPINQMLIKLNDMKSSSGVNLNVFDDHEKTNDLIKAVVFCKNSLIAEQILEIIYSHASFQVNDKSNRAAIEGLLMLYVLILNHPIYKSHQKRKLISVASDFYSKYERSDDLCEGES